MKVEFHISHIGTDDAVALRVSWRSPRNGLIQTAGVLLPFNDRVDPALVLASGFLRMSEMVEKIHRDAPP